MFFFNKKREIQINARRKALEKAQEARVKRHQEAEAIRKKEAKEQEAKEQEAKEQEAKEQEAKARREKEARAKREQEAKSKREKEFKARREKEARARREKEAITRIEKETKEQEAKVEEVNKQETQKKKEKEEAKARREKEVKERREKEANAQKARAKREKEARAKREKEARAKREKEARAKREKEAKENNSTIKVALSFFGITRSLKYTIDSIKKQILDTFKEEDIQFDIFLHTYIFKNDYTNKRTGERKKQEDINNEEYNLLNPTYKQIDVQEDVIEQLNLKQYRSKPDPWKTNYNSVDNYILGCYSKKQLVNLIEKSNNHYDYVIFIRPDCLYTTKFNKDYFKKVNDKTMCLPNFHLNGSHRVNDRFSICNMNNYKIYGNIFDSLLEISKKHKLHSETILGDILKKNKIKVEKINFRFRRMRCNGNITKNDQKI